MEHRDSQAVSPAKVFLSYSHRDEALKKDLDIHLKLLQRQGLMEPWHDRKIIPGENWEAQIDQNIRTADIILLLVSAYFIASDYCYAKEMAVALARHDAGEAVVIPIFLRPCDLQGVPFEKLQGLPEDAIPVTNFTNRHEAWKIVTVGIRRATESLPRKQGILSATGHPINDTLGSVDVSSYLTALVRSYTESTWVARAVPLFAQTKDQDPVDVANALLGWVKRESSTVLFLVGDFRSGKTWAFKRLAKELAEQYLGGKHPRLLPVYVPLARIPREHREPRLKEAVRQLDLDTLPKDIVCLFLFDGLDEVGFHAEEHAETLLRELVRQAPARARFAVSCRTQAFETMPGLLDIQFGTTESDSEDRTEWAISTSLARPVVYKLCVLNSQLANSYLAMGPSATYWSAIRSKKVYEPLLRQPVMLALVERALPELSNARRQPTVAEIYRIALETWIRRDSHSNKLEVDQNKWRDRLADLAGLMFPYGTIDLDKVEAHFARTSDPKTWVNVLINADILQLNQDDALRFSHHSLWEFFVAHLLFRQLQHYDASLLARLNLVYMYATNCFLVSLLRDERVHAGEYSEPLRQSLFDRARAVGGGLLVASPITDAEYRAFLRESRWRRGVGHGQWGSLDTPDGTLAITAQARGAALRAIGTTPLSKSRSKSPSSNQPVTGVSWYDAWQFCRWVGGVLPSVGAIETVPLPTESGLEKEWSQDWFDEQSAQITVLTPNVREAIGVNPDIRAGNL